MSFCPLGYVRPFRPRIMLRINEDGERFRIWDPMHQAWVLTDDEVLGTEACSIRFSNQGSRVDIHSHVGRTQNLFIADTVGQHFIGRIRIEETGRMYLFDDLSTVRVNALSPLWEHKLTAVIGVPGHVTINMRDCQAHDEDMIRYKPGSAKWYIPKKYRTPTVSYDTEQLPHMERAPENNHDVPYTGLRPPLVRLDLPPAESLSRYASAMELAGPSSADPSNAPDPAANEPNTAAETDEIGEAAGGSSSAPQPRADEWAE